MYGHDNMHKLNSKLCFVLFTISFCVIKPCLSLRNIQCKQVFLCEEEASSPTDTNHSRTVII